ncbi:hypothetical protein RHMOL_Rhmol02G0019400 [Rhododendron molle]|uniref:Uncharacterized protein n=1 Tax=Rhododendron molle TaxID=49168 RepID=A0ACC0PM10_RHOML|nr:hypothetical protein RHMOL_Rhmol02G0019400 [Rhododendron molle]
MHIDADLFLWNPLTRFFKKMLAYEELRDEGYGVCSGLCYDSTSNEYKAVFALAHNSPGYGGEFVVVGSFRSKSWTMIDFPYVVPSRNMGPIVNENLHWFASKKDSHGRFLLPHQIIFFNAQMDKFEEVPMPEPRGEDGDILCGLGVLDGYLCMSRSDCPGDSESNVEVLLMKEYGVKSSWTILLVVSDDRFAFKLYDPLVPLGYTKNGSVLIKVNYRPDLHIRAFDVTDNSHRRISIPVHHYLHVFVHEESLITPTDYNWEVEELKGQATYVVHSYTGESLKMKKGSDERY